MSRLFLVLSAFVLLCAHVAIADPGAVSYQGRLTDAAGNPVADDDYEVTFALYSSPTSAVSLWSETRSIQTSQGLFTIDLGTTNPIPDTALTDTAAYLEIAVAGDGPLSPRTRLSSVPYARLSNSVAGGGPLQFGAVDVSNGNEASVYMGANEDPSGTGRVKVKFHWSTDNSGNGKAVSQFVDLDVDTGFLEIVQASTSTGQATGKRQHGPVRITKEWGASNASSAVEWNSVLHADTGITETASMTKAQLVTEIATKMSQTREHVLLARQVGVPGTTDDQRLELETNDSTSALHLTNVSSDDDTSTVSLSGHTRKSASLVMHNTAPTATGDVELSTGPEGPRLLLANSSTQSGPKDDGVILLSTDLPSGPAMKMESIQGQDTSILILTALGTSLNQKFQCASPCSSGIYKQESKMGLQGTSLELSRLSGTDTSGIELVIDDVAPQLALTKLVGGTKWKNIVLKRGFGDGGEVAISHVGAGPHDGVFLKSDAAAGGQVGINTSSPTLAFHLVGSGCYTGSFGACSDRRYKDGIHTLSEPLETIQALRGVEFTWKTGEYPDQHFPQGVQLGLIAQEVEEVLPSLVTTASDGYKSVDYARLSPLLLEAVKAQQFQISAQQRQIDELSLLVDRLLEAQAAERETSYGQR